VRLLYVTIGRKIYYDFLTGCLIVDTGEKRSTSGYVSETTIEQDFTVYAALAERIPSTVGCLQLDYGEYAEDFATCIGYRVDVSGETPSLLFSYPDPEAVGEPMVHRKSFSASIADLENENAMLVLELVNEQIRLDDLERRLAQSESEQAAVLLELVDKKGGAIDGLVRNIKTALRRRTV